MWWTPRLLHRLRLNRSSWWRPRVFPQHTECPDILRGEQANPGSADSVAVMMNTDPLRAKPAVEQFDHGSCEENDARKCLKTSLALQAFDRVELLATVALNLDDSHALRSGYQGERRAMGYALCSRIVSIALWQSAETRPNDDNYDLTRHGGPDVH